MSALGVGANGPWLNSIRAASEPPARPGTGNFPGHLALRRHEAVLWFSESPACCGHGSLPSDERPAGLASLDLSTLSEIGALEILDTHVEKNFVITTVDYVFNWARKSSLWPMTFGLACCFVEFATAATSRFDIARFGMEVYRPSPRQADLMIVAGTLTLKMAPVVRRLYEQIPEPKWVMAMGTCAMTGGPFNTYAVVQGVDRILPADVYVYGCPPRPEALFYGLLKLQDKIDEMSLAHRPTEVRLRRDLVADFKRRISASGMLRR